MIQENITVTKSSSNSPSFSKLIIAMPAIRPYEWCDVVVGFPGMRNVTQKLAVGEAILFETSQDGVLEIRVATIHGAAADFTITQLTPRSGFSAGMITEDYSNSPFTQAERAEIAQSIEGMKSELAASGNHSDEQLSLIYRKLDEINDASSRLARKDWINYVAGSLTSLCISAAFSPETTKSFFKAANSAFAWLFSSAPVLLQF